MNMTMPGKLDCPQVRIVSSHYMSGNNDKGFIDQREKQ